LAQKQKGQPVTAAKKQAPSNVVNLMDALRQSIAGKAAPAASPKPAKAPAKKAAKKRKAG
jgi:DNA end-binding protein Ku